MSCNHHDTVNDDRNIGLSRWILTREQQSDSAGPTWHAVFTVQCWNSTVSYTNEWKLVGSYQSRCSKSALQAVQSLQLLNFVRRYHTVCIWYKWYNEVKYCAQNGATWAWHIDCSWLSYSYSTIIIVFTVSLDVRRYRLQIFRRARIQTHVSWISQSSAVVFNSFIDWKVFVFWQVRRDVMLLNVDEQQNFVAVCARRLGVSDQRTGELTLVKVATLAWLLPLQQCMHYHTKNIEC